MARVLSERDAKRLSEMLHWWDRNKNQRERYRKRRGVNVGGGSEIKIFEVQSAAAGDGVYNCYEQTLDATDWIGTSGEDKFDDKDAVEVEVLNLLENDPVAGYTSMLGLYDRIKAWKISDDEGNSRWVGRPLVNSVRQVRAIEEAPAAEHITCNLLLNNGVEAAEGELGYNIEVYSRICNGTDLNDAMPYIKSSDWLTAYNEQGKWWFTTTLQDWNIC